MDGSGDYAGKYKNWSFVCGSSRVYLQFKESGGDLGRCPVGKASPKGTDS